MANQIQLFSHPSRDFTVFFILMLLVIGGIVVLHGCRKTMRFELVTDPDRHFISFSGTIHPRRYNQYHDRQCGHHFIVWSEGGNAKKALIETNIPDELLLDALIKIGAVPGDNLTEATWSERDNPASTEPDQRVKGTPLDVFVSWNGEERPAHTLFEQIQSDEMDIHVGGHRKLIPVWRSGCVTCLFSCPGGRTSNAAYTIRDQAQNRKIFLANESILPTDGTEVTVRMKLKKEG